MPRIKTTKRAAKKGPVAKRPAKDNVLTQISTIEKECLQSPNKLVAIIDKAIAAAQSDAAKLQQAIKKSKASLAKAANTTKAAAKKANDRKGKQVFAAAQKAEKEISLQLANQTKALHHASNASTPLIEQRARYDYLAKCLIRFEKEWAKLAKEAKAKADAKAKAKEKAKAKAKKAARAAKAAQRKTANAPKPPIALTPLNENDESLISTVDNDALDIAS